MTTRRTLIGLATALLALLAAGCNGDDTNKDAAVDQEVDLGTPDTKRPDLPKPDGPVLKPKIRSIQPDSGFSGSNTPVTLIGENFVQGMAVYIDGQPHHGTVTVASAATAQFTMPPNPYDKNKPQVVTVQVLVKQAMSDLVKFRYVLPIAMTDSFHGVIVTPTLTAKRYILSSAIEGKVLASEGGDAGSAASLEAEVGYGAVGSNPSTDTGWVWMKVALDRKEGETSYFKGAVRFTKEGSFDLAFRFSRDGGYWIFADKDDTNLAYEPSQAAKLTVEVPSPFYCESTEDCAPYPVRAVCNTGAKLCVECSGDGDCTKNPYSFGPKCNTSKGVCYCADDPGCATNPNGALCVEKPNGYCGCKDSNNCTGGKKCPEQVPEGERFTCS